MRKYCLLALLCAFLFASCKEPVRGGYDVIPLPQQVTAIDGDDFVINRSTKIMYPAGNEKLAKAAEILSDYIGEMTGYSLKVTDRDVSKNVIVLKTGLENANKEAYRLTVNKKAIIIKGASEAGTFFGAQTLRKSIPAYSDGANVFLAPVEINDWPRFPYRGMHLDVGRHMFPLEFIKQYIDMLALHNMNTFHWHLTEDQGWRIEINKYPKLTEVGGYRTGTLIGHGGRPPFEYDDIPYGGFYTQDEAREIVQYAADRFITVIPEIDLPGHMTAALTAYPELGCTGGPYEVVKRWGVFPEILCGGKEGVFEFLEGVFDELLDIFPSHYIHVGGDEAPKTRWEACPDCQAKIKELGIEKVKGHTPEQQLQSYFISRVEKMLNGKGRDIIGWDEILEGGLAPNATVMSWQGVGGGIAAARQGHDAIMTPTQFFYFDYYQTRGGKEEPDGIGGFVPIEKVYSFDLPAELTEDQKKHIIGVQANMWTEYTKTPEVVEFRVLPRMDALSEVQWTMPARKNYDDFLRRLNGNMKAIYDKNEWNYAPFVMNAE